MEVTQKCNLKCIHCYADSGPDRPLHDHMTPDTWAEVLAQAASMGCRAVQFIGGEPTMYPALGILIERARALGFKRIEVYTNGTMLKRGLMELLLRHKVDVAFSVYSSDSQTHDLVTKQVGSFDRALASIQWALDSGLSVRASIIEMDANAGQSEQTRDMLRAMGVKQIGIDRERGVGRGAKVDLQVSTERVHGTKREARHDSPGSGFDELCGACWRGNLAITATGQIFPCVFSRNWLVGHASQGLRAVIEGLPLRKFRHEMRANQRSRQSQNGARTESCAPGAPSCEPQTPCGPELTPCVPELPCAPDPGCLPHLICGPDKPLCVPACLPKV